MTLTFQQNWDNLVTRLNSMTDGKVDKDISRQHPLSDNFKTWAGNNWVAVRAKLDYPELDLEHNPRSRADYINYMLNTSNKYFEKEGIFPVSYTLTHYMSNLGNIEEALKSDILAWLDGCIVCDAPKDEGNHLHCPTCEKLVEYTHDPVITQSLKDNQMLVGEAKIEITVLPGNVLQYKRVPIIEEEIDYLAPKRTRLKYEDMDFINLRREVYYSNSVSAQKEINKRTESQYRMLNISPNTLANIRRERKRWENEDNTPIVEDTGDDFEEEFGENPYYEAPEIIEAEGDFKNPQSIGVDEYGDDIYSDFDDAGHFLPMGNSNNSTDYQDDFDPDDLAAQSWNSVDDVEDHHLDEYHYREVGVTETPVFITERYVEREDTPWKNERMEWETESYSDIEKVRTAESDMDFVADARNWLTRENLVKASPAQAEAIYQAYPVSYEFLKYIDDNEIDFETANARLEEYVGIRKENTESKRQKASQRYAAGESIEDVAASLYLDISEVRNTINQQPF